jgi:hypothetical protein
MSGSHAVLVVLMVVAGVSMGTGAAAAGSCESNDYQPACVAKPDVHVPLLAQLTPGKEVGTPVLTQSARPLAPLCRDYKEFIDRRPMVDRQQVALLPKFQMLEEVCFAEGRPPAMSNYKCTLPSGKSASGSCCVGLWDCFDNHQATCDQTEILCKGLGAAWSTQ